VLRRELGGGRDLDALGVAEGALGERGEPSQRFDLITEQVDAHRPVLGGSEQVEQSTADRELAAILDLVDPLITGGDELQRGLLQVHQLPDAQHEALGSQRPLGHLLRERHRGDDDHRRAIGPRGGRRVSGVRLLQHRVQSGDPQADEVWRRREVGLVGDTATGVVPHRPRLQPRAQPGGELPGGAVIAGDHDRRAVGVTVQERSDEKRAQRLRHERLAAVASQRGGLRIVVGMGKKGTEHRKAPPSLGTAGGHSGSPRTTASTASPARPTSACTSAGGSEKRPRT
jgi:hypothetical protein